MDRRNFIKLASAASLAVGLPEKKPAQAQPAETPAPPPASPATPPAQPAPTQPAQPAAPTFSEEWLLGQAETLAANPFAQPVLNLPAELADLDRRRYDAIRNRPDATLWKDEPLALNLQFFHTGFQYKTPVEINIVEGGQIRPFPYSASLFDFADPLKAPPPDSQSGFSGFRVLGPLNSNDGKDAFISFQGASYFRAIATGQVFGAITRAISINAAQPEGEEFAFYRSFYIVKPAAGERKLTAYALLDSPSLSGAYKFTMEPGRTTVVDVECSLFPRRNLTHVGIAPLSGMYFFGKADPTLTADYRPNVHATEGLQIWTSTGEWIWRPVTNPEQLQYSVFVDRTPRGFGLLQREREFGHYEDIDARFGDRPSIWVEPIGDWGDGAVDLIEVPSTGEIYDNIIAFWRSKTPLVEKARRSFRYRLHWGWETPVRSTQALVKQTRIGDRGSRERRLFVIDFVSGHSCNACNVPQFTAALQAGDGEIRNVMVRANPATGGQRVTFEFRPGGERQTDLRCQLQQNGQVVSETWVYRWQS
jgi:glucans biosynthesis protein